MSAQNQGAVQDERWQVIPRTLCFVTYGEHILLLKRGPQRRVFPNHYNGLGGHIERHEDPWHSAVREIREESGLEVVNVHYRGTTHIDAGTEVGIMLFVFTAEATSQNVIDSTEGTLEWLHLPTLLAHMAQHNTDILLVEDLPIFLPRLYGPTASSTPFFARASYDAQNRLQFAIAPAQ
jgi:8-oxo-dGTP diphosphatase